MTKINEDKFDETELQSDPSWDYYHEFLKERERDPASSFDSFLDKVPADLREKVRLRIQDLEQMESLLSSRREDTEMPRIEGYELERTLGRGGMGRVYLARRVSDGTMVALKVFRAQPIFEKRARALFDREVAAIESLDHESIGGIVDRDPSGDGHWIAMELIDGVSLSAEIKAQKACVDPATDSVVDKCVLRPWQSGDYVRQVAGLMLDTARALAHAHERGVYHRDVKPSNILVKDGEHAVLVDFGLAKIMEEESRTGVGDLLGTLGYMSPEQILARRVPIDQRTDFWSFGVTFYEVLALRRPFEGESYEEIHRQVCFEEPAALQSCNPRVSRDLSRIIERCLQKNPRDRFASADEIVLHLEEFLQHRKVSLAPLSLGLRLQVAWKRHRRVAIGMLVLCLVLLSGTIALAWSRALDFAKKGGAAHSRMMSTVHEWEQREMHALQAGLIRQRMAQVRESLALYDDDDRGSGQVILDMATAEGERRLSLGRELLAEGALAGPWDPKVGKMPDPVKLQQGKKLVEDAGSILKGDRSWFDEESRKYTLSWMTIHKPQLPDHAGEIRVRYSYWVARDCAFSPPVELKLEFGRPFSLVPGICRFEIRVDGHGSGEFVRRMITPGERQELHPRILETGRVIAKGMSPVEGGECLVGGMEKIHPYRRHKVQIPSFYMDTHEVTAGDYLAFMKATGAPRPANWPTNWKALYLKRIEEEWSDRPVTNVTIQQARAYAEWRGKRLPTAWEWERAARGKEGGSFLWGAKSKFFALGKEGKYDEPKVSELASSFALTPFTRTRATSRLVRYLSVMHPVGSFPADCTAEGIYDLLGNAMELTESLALQTWSGMDPKTLAAPTQIFTSYSSFLIKGACVISLDPRTVNPNLGLALSYYSGTQGRNSGPYAGFRCVKSILE